MKKSFNRLIITSFFLILSLSLTVTSYSQSTSLSFNYNVNIGDSNSYLVTNFEHLSNNYFLDQFLLENQSFLEFNITQGISFNVIVANKNQTSSNVEQVFINVYLNIPGKGSFKSPIEYSYEFIQPAFTNLTEAKNYYSIAFSQVYNPTFVIQGNLITLSSNYTSNNITSFITQEFSLKTGWLKQFSSKLVYPNSTVLLEYTLEKQSPGIISKFMKESIIVIESVILVIGVVFMIILGLKVKTITKRNKTSSEVKQAIDKIDKMIKGND